MEYRVEELGPLKRKIAVSVPAGDVNAVLDRVVARYRASAAIPGFRKGRAPVDMVEKRFGRDIFPEAANNLLEEQVNRILQELKVEPASQINYDYDADFPFRRGQDFAYAFTLEVMPDFILPDYAGFPVEQEEAELAADEVENVLAKIRMDMSSLEPVEEKRLPCEGDVVRLDYIALDEEGAEVPGVKGEDVSLNIGGEQLVPDFESLVRGFGAGDEGEGPVLMPENFSLKEIAGKKLRFKVKIKALFKRKLQELDDDFARKVGSFADLEALRSAIRKDILRTRENFNEREAQKRLLHDLVLKTDYPLPKEMVERRATILAVEKLQDLARERGLPEKPEESLRELREQVRPEADQAVRLYIFLQRVAREEGVEVEEHDVMRFFQGMAAVSGRSPDEITREYRAEDKFRSLYERIATEKTIKALYAKAAVTLVKKSGSLSESQDMGTGTDKKMTAEGVGSGAEKITAESAEESAVPAASAGEAAAE
jgi:trigger factor